MSIVLTAHYSEIQVIAKNKKAIYYSQKYAQKVTRQKETLPKIAYYKYFTIQ